jgi:hypothetical protein
MRTRWIVPAALLVALTVASSAPAAAQRVRPIETSLSLSPGQARALYAVRGVSYGTVGRFFVTCPRSGRARTAYVLARGLSATVAVDGRGASRGRRLHASGSRLVGGTKPSGIERWVVRTGGKPESIELDASLLVLSGRSCEFALSGRVVVTRH